MAKQNIGLTAQILKEGKMFVAFSPELDLSSCGYTTEEAKNNLEEAIELFISETRKMGRLEEILEEAGFRKKEKSWQGPEFIGFEKISIFL